METNLLRVRDIVDENYKMNFDLVELFSKLHSPNKVWVTFVHHKSLLIPDSDNSQSENTTDEVLLNFDLTEYITTTKNGYVVNEDDKIIKYSQMHTENMDDVIWRIQFLDELLSIKQSEFEHLYDKYFKGMNIDGYVVEDEKIRFNLNQFSEIREEILKDDILRISEISFSK